MGLVHAFKKGEVPASKVSKAVKDAAKSMSKKSVKKYAKTKHDDLPKKVTEEKIKSEALGQTFISITKDFNNECMKIAKEMTSIKGDKVDGRIFLKQVQKSLVPLVKLMNSWNKGQQKNPGLTTESKACLCEACQKGYMTHPTRKTKIMFGKRYRNCVKKEDVNEYTYGIGDIVKDINPTCPHNGAMGRVKSVNPKSVVFVVINKGKNYKPGDVLDKTHDQMKKMELSENLQDRMKDVMKSLAKSLKLKSVVSMHTGSGSFSYFMDDKSEVNKLASMLKKKLKRVRIINLDKSKGDTANFVVAADLFNI
tara:strand:- start:506 stop:1432 length:927 start_codon:yes stop_codon:yes gene_type:complete